MLLGKTHVTRKCELGYDLFMCILKYLFTCNYGYCMLADNKAMLKAFHAMCTVI